MHNCLDLTRKTKKEKGLIPCHVESVAAFCLLSKVEKRRFHGCQHGDNDEKVIAQDDGQLFNTSSTGVKSERKANCSTLRKRITRLKMSIQKSSRCKFSHKKGVPSNGPMAPCRSHHGNHTRLERINKVIHRELNPLHAKTREKCDLRESTKMYPSE